MSIVSEYDLDQLKQIVAESCNYAEVARKIGYKSKSSYGIIAKYLAEQNISIMHFTNLPKGIEKRSEENVFIENSTADQATLRRWYIKGNYSEYKCAICGQEPMWQGKELALTLDHINGINNDDRIENLRWICPNCDRQLETYGSKNAARLRKLQNKKIESEKKYYCIDCGKEICGKNVQRCTACSGLQQRKIERPSAEELITILTNNQGNFSAVGRIFNVSDNAIRKWCKSYNLPTHSSNYK